MGPPGKASARNSQLVPASWFVSPSASARSASESSPLGGKRQAGTGAPKDQKRKSVEGGHPSPSQEGSQIRRKDERGQNGQVRGDATRKPGVSIHSPRDSARMSKPAEPAPASGRSWRDDRMKTGDIIQSRHEGKSEFPRKDYRQARELGNSGKKPWEKDSRGGQSSRPYAENRFPSFARNSKGEEEEDEEEEPDATSVGEGERERMLAAAMAAIEEKDEQAVLSDVEEEKGRGKGKKFARDAKRKREAGSATKRGTGNQGENRSTKAERDGEVRGREEEESKKRRKGNGETNKCSGDGEENARGTSDQCRDVMERKEDGRNGGQTDSGDEDDDEYQLHIVKRPVVSQETQEGKRSMDNAADRKSEPSGPSPIRTEPVTGRDRDRWRGAGQRDHRNSRPSAGDRGGSFGFDVSAGEKRFFPPLGEKGTETREAEENAKEATEREEAGEEETAELLRFVPKVLPFAGARRTRTLSVALPASIIDNAQTAELRAALVGQIARTLTVFGVDEIIVYEDVAAAISRGNAEDGHSRALEFFVRNLRYLETPQFLRKSLFPIHSDLRFAGLQNPLDAPHHLRRNEWLPYREGVVVASSKTRQERQHAKATECDRAKGPGDDVKLTAAEKKRLKNKQGAWVECGLPALVWIPNSRLEDGMRVTVRLDASVRQLQRQPQERGDAEPPLMRGVAVSPDEPPVKAGLYWGYRVRIAQHFQDVFSSCPFSADGRYDLTVGTSERGACVGRGFEFPRNYRHMLLVFGGLQGLEAVLLDRQSNCAPCRDPSTLFDMYLNTCAFQRSRTIRAEEAVPITLALLRPYLLETDWTKKA
ncbi:conserved hypothetical protein [Neospora caninum Liverpool]|uniref:RNA methyltransferase n=1 Tax=Neospora caninum (strain Liverpool) TaxID=572307 RepID=F0VDD8_NEOCL|nr:conserved hypothetical protein [Neospora caninum Liverpool]CBZ51653.1 conserved hypothetical protein [Neospora caninum Liverpool]CEL65607.1 TPA: hypothetical protein BN1204_014470 [Neospora caninum Liverpool]|eukprot:XP_003881686.1 conserved hypothetical protein [Neospora caninum Liverpool]